MSQEFHPESLLGDYDWSIYIISDWVNFLGIFVDTFLINSNEKSYTIIKQWPNPT